MRERLDVLYITMFPASPPRYGAQRRLQGIMQSLARRHSVTAISLITPDLDPREAEQAMRSYCEDVVLVRSHPWEGSAKRMRQLRALFSLESYEQRGCRLSALQRAVDQSLRSKRHDVVNIEAPYLAHLRLTQAPDGAPRPRVVLDEHNVEFDLARQMARTSDGVRWLHNTVNWPKIRREELAAWRRLDGVTFTSAPDEARARVLVPTLRSRVIPNAADLAFFRPKPGDPPADGRTILFFGAINYFPNIDGIRFFVREIWPRVSAMQPNARLKIVGQHPTPEILAFRSSRIEVTGRVDDVRPHLASAAVAIVPLRIGGGTRLKVLEAMAMSKPIVSTARGAEGIDATHGRNILIADTPAEFAASVGRVLDDRRLAAQLGEEGRALVEERYSWDAVAQSLETFFFEVLSATGSRTPSRVAAPFVPT